MSLVDGVKQGINLARAASDLMRGGFSMSKMNEAKHIFQGAKSLFDGLQHKPTEEGLGKEHFVEGWEENKDVWMFSGMYLVHFPCPCVPTYIVVQVAG